MWKRAGAVSLGGALGGVLRYGIGEVFHGFASTLPWGTLLANVFGSLALGALMGAALEVGWPRPGWREFWTIGFLGSLTTFSTLALETLHAAAGSPWLGVLNLGIHLFFGLGAAWIGFSASRQLARRVRRAHGPTHLDQLCTDASSGQEATE